MERVVHELEHASEQMNRDLAADDINLRRIMQYKHFVNEHRDALHAQPEVLYKLAAAATDGLVKEDADAECAKLVQQIAQSTEELKLKSDKGVSEAFKQQIELMQQQRNMMLAKTRGVDKCLSDAEQKKLNVLQSKMDEKISQLRKDLDDELRNQEKFAALRREAEDLFVQGDDAFMEEQIAKAKGLFSQALSKFQQASDKTGEARANEMVVKCSWILDNAAQAERAKQLEQALLLIHEAELELAQWKLVAAEKAAKVSPVSAPSATELGAPRPLRLARTSAPGAPRPAAEWARRIAGRTRLAHRHRRL